MYKYIFNSFFIINKQNEFVKLTSKFPLPIDNNNNNNNINNEYECKIYCLLVKILFHHNQNEEIQQTILYNICQYISSIYIILLLILLINY